MATIATATLNSLAGSLLGRTAYTAPATLYAAFIIGASDGVSGGTEAAGGNYSRTAVTNNTTNFPAPSGGVVTTGTNIVSPRSSAAWGAVNCLRFFDASTAGNLVAGGLLSPSVSVDATGITITVEAGSLTLTLSSP